MHCPWTYQPQLRQSISFTSPMWDASPTSSLLLPLLGIYSSQTEAFSPLRVSIQKLTERDADTHSQTVDRAWGLLWKNRRKNCWP
ncbi:mCG1050052 [Mus musculus]|nr:mCG1050052 [Mus musculus]